MELNPVRAGMVSDPGDYRWSSYRAHAFGLKARLWSPHRLYLQLASNRDGVKSPGVHWSTTR
jgi:putative transposase